MKIFVSYAREDIDHARVLTSSLRAAGLEVWWDEQLNAAHNFRNKIWEQHDQADRVVVIWTAHSASSTWVRKEAKAAYKSRKLLSTVVQAGDVNFIPSKFRHLHALSVTDVPKLVHSLHEGQKNLREPSKAWKVVKGTGGAVFGGGFGAGFGAIAGSFIAPGPGTAAGAAIGAALFGTKAAKDAYNSGSGDQSAKGDAKKK